MSRYRHPVLPHMAKSPPETPKPKLPHVKAQRVTASMTDGQKEGVRMWNIMQKTLIDNGLMEKD